MAASIERTAFSLMMEEPGLPATVALRAVTHDAITLPEGALVESADMLRWAAIGLAVLNGESVESAVARHAE